MRLGGRAVKFIRINNISNVRRKILRLYIPLNRVILTDTPGQNDPVFFVRTGSHTEVNKIFCLIIRMVEGQKGKVVELGLDW